MWEKRDFIGVYEGELAPELLDMLDPDKIYYFKEFCIHFNGGTEALLCMGDGEFINNEKIPNDPESMTLPMGECKNLVNLIRTNINNFKHS